MQVNHDLGDEKTEQKGEHNEKLVELQIVSEDLTKTVKFGSEIDKNVLSSWRHYY